jgi:hypothetical protein
MMLALCRIDAAEVAAQRDLRQLRQGPHELHAGGTCADQNERLLRLELTDRRRDLGGRENRRGHLIEQRLKYVVVAAVDH